MQQGIQSKLRNYTLRISGCYFLCLLKWAEIHSRAEFSEGAIERFWELAREAETVDKSAKVFVPHAILNLATGTNDFSRIVWPFPTTVSENQTYPYIEFLRKPRFGHFVLRLSATETWDPLPPDRASAAKYELYSLRIIT